MFNSISLRCFGSLKFDAKQEVKTRSMNVAYVRYDVYLVHMYQCSHMSLPNIRHNSIHALDSICLGILSNFISLVALVLQVRMSNRTDKISGYGTVSIN